MEPVHVSTGVFVRDLTPCGNRGMVTPLKFTCVPPKLLCLPTHHHKVELTANAAECLENKGDPGHLSALCVLQHWAWRAGDSVGTLLALPHGCVPPAPWGTPLWWSPPHLKPGTTSVRIMKSLSEAPAAV